MANEADIGTSITSSLERQLYLDDERAVLNTGIPFKVEIAQLARSADLRDPILEEAVVNGLMRYIVDGSEGISDVIARSIHVGTMLAILSLGTASLESQKKVGYSFHELIGSVLLSRLSWYLVTHTRMSADILIGGIAKTARFFVGDIAERTRLGLQKEAQHVSTALSITAKSLGKCIMDAERLRNLFETVGDPDLNEKVDALGVAGDDLWQRIKTGSKYEFLDGFFRIPGLPEGAYMHSVKSYPSDSTLPRSAYWAWRSYCHVGIGGIPKLNVKRGKKVYSVGQLGELEGNGIREAEDLFSISKTDGSLQPFTPYHADLDSICLEAGLGGSYYYTRLLILALIYDMIRPPEEKESTGARKKRLAKRVASIVKDPDMKDPQDMLEAIRILVVPRVEYAPLQPKIVEMEIGPRGVRGPVKRRVFLFPRIMRERNRSEDKAKAIDANIDAFREAFPQVDWSNPHVTYVLFEEEENLAPLLIVQRGGTHERNSKQ